MTFRVFLLLVMFSNFSFAQCDCDIYPIKKECRQKCATMLLQNGTVQQLKKELNIDHKTAEDVVRIPDRNKKNSLNELKNDLPPKSYETVKLALERWAPGITINQHNTNGNNIGRDYIVHNYYPDNNSEPSKPAKEMLEECSKNNTGDFCFTNLSRRKLIIKISTEGAYRLYTNCFPPKCYEITLEPNETQCLYNKSANQYYYTAYPQINSLTNEFDTRAFSKGNIIIEKCKSNSLSIR